MLIAGTCSRLVQIADGHWPPVVTIAAILLGAIVNTGLAQTPATSMARRIQANLEAALNTKASADERNRAQVDLLSAIRTPGGQDRFIVMFDDREFAIRAGNWLQTVKPSTPKDCITAGDIAIGVLHDTNDSQVILAMVHAILRQMLNQIEADPKVNPLILAATIIKEIGDAADSAVTPSKMRVLKEMAASLAGEEVTAGQRRFLERMYSLAQPRTRALTRGNSAAQTNRPPR